MVSAIFENFLPFIGGFIIFLIILYGLLFFILRKIATPRLFPKVSADYTEKEPDIEFLTLQDGTQIATINAILPEANKCILFSHGNAQDLNQCRPIIKRFNDLGYSAFTYDYPGYGLSKGVASEKSFFQAAKEAYRYLTLEKGFQENQIILYGYSIGSGPTSELAQTTNAAAAIIEGGFTSPYRIYTRYGILPGDFFRNIRKINKIKKPLLVLHGTKDPTVPYSHGLRLFKRANHPKQMETFPEGKHGNLFSDFQDSYNKKLTEFIENL
jgi:hypothetical protein